MIDYQVNVIEAVKTILSTVTELKRVGEYIEDEPLGQVGQKNPVCLIRYDGEDTAEADTGLSITPTLRINLRIYIDRKPPYTMLKNCMLVVNAVNEAMLDDLSLGGVVDNTILDGVDVIDYDAQQNVYECKYRITLRVLR
jgi:hypothetical protein